MRSMAAGLLLLAGWAIALAQTPASRSEMSRDREGAATEKPTPAKVEGRVVDAITGEPVAKVKLRLLAARMGTVPETETAVTDADGRFSFKAVSAGMYRLMGEKVGYLNQAYGATGPDRFVGTVLTLSAGQELKDLEFKLTPQAVIAGRVLDEDGEPSPRAAVMVAQLRGAGQRARPVAMANETANDLGEYRVADLTPGRYIVSAVPQERFRDMDERVSMDKAPREVIITTYYPGTTDPGAAGPVELQAGQQATGIDIPLQKARVHRVEGRIAGLTSAESTRNLRLHIQPRDRNAGVSWFGLGGGGVKEDGSFQIANVRPGSYYLGVYTTLENGSPAMVGRTSIDVADQDLKGVIMTLSEALDVSGVVRVEGESKQRHVDGLHVMLRHVDDGSYVMRPAMVKPDGSFKLDSVMPDRYFLDVYGFPETLYLKAVRLGKQDALVNGMDLSQAQGTAIVEVLLGTKPGTVEGSVKKDTKPAPGMTVFLLPDAAGPAQRYLFKVINTDQNGQFTFRGVAPGEYRLYAWEGDIGFDPWRGELPKGLEEKGKRVTVSEGATARADLEPLKPEDGE